MKADGTDYASRVASGEPLAGMLSGRLSLVWAHAQVVYDSPDKRQRRKEGDGRQADAPDRG